MKNLVFILCVFSLQAWGQGSYPPAAGLPGSTAIHMDSNVIYKWVQQVDVVRGWQDITQGNGPLASAGTPALATGKADGACVSLGDGGSAIITLVTPLSNDTGYDFAIFENGFYDAMRGDYFLELGTVWVSDNGIDYVRFPCHSETSIDQQIGSFDVLNPSYLDGFAGKYEMQYGTPFDLAILDTQMVDINAITHIKIEDAIGYLDSTHATYDDDGRPVNDPWPTAFPVGGFDLDAVALLRPARPNSISSPAMAEVNVYPNPTADFLYFSRPVDVQLYSLHGQLITKLEEVSEVNLSNCKTGVYMILIEVEGVSRMMKVVKY